MIWESEARNNSCSVVIVISPVVSRSISHLIRYPCAREFDLSMF